MIYALCILIGALGVVFFGRMLLTIFRWGLLLVGVLVAGRLVLLADSRLGQADWISGAVIGGVAAFVVVGLLSYSLIYHALIAADERRDIDRAREQAQRRRLW